MTDFMTLVKSRSSIRAYTNQKVESEKLEKILEAARSAPTVANLQPIILCFSFTSELMSV